jgi:hypothetical protein
MNIPTTKNTTLITNITIHGSPQILASAMNRDENHVEEPPVARRSLSPLHRASVGRPESLTPLPGGFIGDDYSTLSQQILDMTKTQAEPMIEPGGLADDRTIKWLPLIELETPANTVYPIQCLVRYPCSTAYEL